MQTKSLMLSAAGCLLTAVVGFAYNGSTASQDEAMDEGQAALAEVLAQGGVTVDFESDAIAISTRLIVTHDLLEYVLVGPNGSGHESLLTTDVKGSMIHAGLTAVGVGQGQNAAYFEVDPAPSEEELRAGAKRYGMTYPSGDGIFPYLAWREGEEVYFVRVEDVINNALSGRTMVRHRWVYIGSRFAKLREDGPEVFMADAEQNLINLAFFTEGNTLSTASLPECEIQTIWSANPWVLPPPGEPVRLILAHERLASIPAALAIDLPEPNRDLGEAKR
jgi:hypothetical protein